MFILSISLFLPFPLFYSQQVFQIENIHIDKGATIVEKNSNEEITYTSYDDNSKMLVKEVINLNDKKIFAKKYNSSQTKEKSIKEVCKKTFNNKKETKTNFVYNKASNSNSSFSSSYEINKQINTNTNNYNSKFINNNKNWVVALYFVEQEQCVLYKSYNSKNIVTRFFTRPPPYNRFV